MKYMSISRASSPPKVTSGHLEQSCGRFWPLPENSHMRARAMPKSCPLFPTCGGKDVQQFCYQLLMDALEKSVTSWLNAGSATTRNDLHFERYIYFFNAKIWVSNPSAVTSLTLIVSHDLHQWFRNFFQFTKNHNNNILILHIKK